MAVLSCLNIRVILVCFVLFCFVFRMYPLLSCIFVLYNSLRWRHISVFYGLNSRHVCVWCSLIIHSGWIHTPIYIMKLVQSDDVVLVIRVYYSKPSRDFRLSSLQWRQNAASISPAGNDVKPQRAVTLDSTLMVLHGQKRSKYWPYSE